MTSLKGKKAKAIFELLKGGGLTIGQIKIKTGFSMRACMYNCYNLREEGYLLQEGDIYYQRGGAEQMIQRLLTETKSRDMKQLGFKINILESKIAVPIIKHIREHGPSKGMDIAEGNKEYRSNTYMYLGYLRKYGFVKKEGQLNILQESFIRHFNKEVDDFKKWLKNK